MIRSTAKTTVQKRTDGTYRVTVRGGGGRSAITGQVQRHTPTDGGSSGTWKKKT